MAALYCAHRTSPAKFNDPSMLACFTLLGMAPVLVPLRPSNEAIDTPSKLARFSFHGVAWLILDCARRTSTFLSCAFREQEDDQATPSHSQRPERPFEELFGECHILLDI